MFSKLPDKKEEKKKTQMHLNEHCSPKSFSQANTVWESCTKQEKEARRRTEGTRYYFNETELFIPLFKCILFIPLYMKLIGNITITVIITKSEKYHITRKKPKTMWAVDGMNAVNEMVRNINIRNLYPTTINFTELLICVTVLMSIYKTNKCLF